MSKRVFTLFGKGQSAPVPANFARLSRVGNSLHGGGHNPNPAKLAEKENMKKETNSLPERFAAKGQEFIDDLQANCRYACGVLWWKCGCGWMPERSGTVSLHLRCRYNATPKEATQIRHATSALEPGPQDPEFLRAVRHYARKRGMQEVAGQWVRVPQAKWDAMPVDELVALLMSEYDEGRYSQDDWNRLSELLAEEIRVRRGSGEKIDTARRKNAISGSLTGLAIFTELQAIGYEIAEIVDRPYRQAVS